MPGFLNPDFNSKACIITKEALGGCNTKKAEVILLAGIDKQGVALRRRIPQQCMGLGLDRQSQANGAPCGMRVFRRSVGTDKNLLLENIEQGHVSVSFRWGDEFCDHVSFVEHIQGLEAVLLVLVPKEQQKTKEVERGRQRITSGKLDGDSTRLSCQVHVHVCIVVSVDFRWEVLWMRISYLVAG